MRVHFSGARICFLFKIADIVFSPRGDAPPLRLLGCELLSRSFVAPQLDLLSMSLNDRRPKTSENAPD